MTGRLDAETVARARARAVPVIDEIHRRSIPLRQVGLELVGACPVCGDSGKGNRSNRFAVHPRKNAWLCRQCEKGGGVIDLVMHLYDTRLNDWHRVTTAAHADGARPRTEVLWLNEACWQRLEIERRADLFSSLPRMETVA